MIKLPLGEIADRISKTLEMQLPAPSINSLPDGGIRLVWKSLDNQVGLDLDNDANLLRVFTFTPNTSSTSASALPKDELVALARRQVRWLLDQQIKEK